MESNNASPPSFRYFGSGAAAPFHVLSNFNECRIVGHVYVREDGEKESGIGSNSSQSKGEMTKASLPTGGDDADAKAPPAVLPATVKLVEREFVFPSAEHYWWAHFTKRVSDVSRLAVGGDLSTLEGGFTLLLGSQRGVQKAKHWRKKDNVGIVAKMAAAASSKSRKTTTAAAKKRTPPSTTGVNDVRHHRPRAKELGMELGIHPLEQYGGQGEMATLQAIWKKIQTDKYAQNQDHRRVLVSTGSETLVEFVRMKPEGHTWGGQVRGGVRRAKGLIENGGELVGGNFTGECIMSVRDALQ